MASLNRSLPLVRQLVLLSIGLVPLAARAEGSEVSIVDRLITVVSSIVVPILIALLGHRLGEARTKKEEERVRGKSLVVPPPSKKTALNWLAEVGNVAAPASQLITPSRRRRKWMPLAVTGALVGIGIITGVLVSRLVATNDRPAVAAPAPVAIPGTRHKMFVDRGQHFVRAGTDDGLATGGEVSVLDTKGAVVGEGTVVEAWERMARVSVDPPPAAGAVLQAAFVPCTRPAAPVAAPSPARAPRPATPPIPSAAPAAPAGLRGDASLSGFGPGKRLRLYNTGTTRWTRCEARLPSNRRYRFDAMAAGESDGIMLSRFEQDGVERDLEPAWVSVACAEGSVRLNIRAQ